MTLPHSINQFGRWYGALGIVAAIAVCSAGCGGTKKTAKKDANKAATQAAESATKESPCDAALMTLDETFTLERLGRTTRVEDGVLRLNDWQIACGAENATTKLPAEIQKLLSPEQLKLLGEPRFTTRDSEHLRTCLVDKRMARYGVGNGESEIERIVNLFDHVVRGVGLQLTTPEKLPLIPYDVYLLGKGTAEDRAWIFINVLRQLRIDAVVLAPHEPPAPADDGVPESTFLVGVLLNSQVYLFDPRAGLAIPTAAAAGGSTKIPATLAQATADEAVLKQLDVPNGKSYPLTATNMKQPDVLLAADAALWSGRMGALQEKFVADRAMVISDPLQDAGEGFPGLVNRVLKAGGDTWSADRVGQWNFVEKRLRGHASMNEDQREFHDALMLAFGASKSIASDPQGRPVLVDTEKFEDTGADRKHHEFGVNVISRTTTGAQMRARINHLEGNFPQAVREYLEVRDRCRDVLKIQVPIAEQVRHRRAIEDATYWTALCQYELGEYRMAIHTLTHYRKRPESKSWIRESRNLLAHAYAAVDEFEEAIATLKEIEPNDPEFVGLQWLIRHWQGLAKQSAK